MNSRLGLCERQRARVATVALLVMALLPAAFVACGDTAIDSNEPNDDLDSAHVLTPGVPVDGVIGPDDSDVFACAAPEGDAVRSFVVTVRTEAPQDVELQVGASIPGAWEGISWPGWDVVAKGDRLESTGTLREGTVLMFLQGASGTSYSIDLTWM